jgi:serine protease
MKKYLYLGLLVACQMASAEELMSISEQVSKACTGIKDEQSGKACIEAVTEQVSKVRSEIIEGSYIVTLNPDEPEIMDLFAEVQKKLEDAAQLAKIKEDFAVNMGIDGIVEHIFSSTHAVHIKMNSFEAQLLNKDKRILRIEPDLKLRVQNEQVEPGWALDRIDGDTAALDNFYRWNANGAGRTIYILDTGVNTSLPEFGGRAVTVWDVNDPDHKTPTWGQDCNGHGTAVADAAGGNLFGVAKGVSIISAKITQGCSDTSSLSTHLFAFDWLAKNAPAGTIVNWSNGAKAADCNVPVISTALEDAMRAAYAHGVIIVVSAGNDGCDTANYSPTRIDEVFVVGATGSALLSSGKDAKWPKSRTGRQIDLFAPGQNVPLYGHDGALYAWSGTSVSAPFVSGLFAIGCQLYPSYCAQPKRAFDGLKSAMTPNTVTNPDGTPLTGATSLMIKQSW